MAEASRMACSAPVSCAGSPRRSTSRDDGCTSSPMERLSQPHLFDASGIGLIRRGDWTVVYDVLAVFSR